MASDQKIMSLRPKKTSNYPVNQLLDILKEISNNNFYQLIKTFLYIYIYIYILNIHII